MIRLWGCGVGGGGTIIQPRFATCGIELLRDLTRSPPACSCIIRPHIIIRYLSEEIKRPLNQESQLKPGTLVAVRTDGNRIGTIIEARPLRDGQADYVVFFGRSEQLVLSGRDIEPISGSGVSVTTIDHSKFLARLGLAKIRNKLTDSLFSVQASRTHLEPYQFKPVLKFLSNGRRRLMLADEVGLGKTIESGLILTELAARETIRRVLIVCPARLREKWRDELYSRFDQQFDILDSRGAVELAGAFERQGDSFSCKAIIGLETLRSKNVLERIEESFIDFDFALIDEAHHLRNPSTAQNEAGFVISERSSAFLMLTATPIQLDASDFYQLFHILDQGAFGSLEEFDRLQEPNLIINEAAKILGSGQPDALLKAVEVLRDVESTGIRDRFLGSPIYRSLLERMYELGNLSPRDQVALQRDLRSLNTLSDVITRTTKRDVRLGGGKSVQRTPHIVSVKLRDDEKRLYEAILNFARAEYHANNPTGRSVGFATVQRERQAASCLPAMTEYLEEWVSKADAKIGFEGVTDEEIETDSAGDQLSDDYRWSNDLGYEKARIEMMDAARHSTGPDTKAEHFIEILKQLRTESPDAKVLVFSTFKRTLTHLETSIRNSDAIDSASVFRIDGDMKIQARPLVTERFRNNEGFSVLLMSEVGAEGLDYQFSDTLINYDLPWNPMRVEQRIGRLDRYGQESDRVRIYSFVLEDTIEERILARLYRRIKIFEESIGDLAPILGEPLSEIEKLVFSASLSEVELLQQSERIILQIENERKEREVLWESKDTLLHQELLLEQEAISMLETGKYLSPIEIRHIVTEFIETSFSGATLSPAPSGESFVLTVSESFVQHFQRRLHTFDTTSDIKAELGTELKPFKKLALVFSGEHAQKRRAAKFINLRHPFFVEALKFFDSEVSFDPESEIGSIQSATGDPDLVGQYVFFVYSMKSLGHAQRSELVPLVFDKRGKVNEQLEERLLEQIVQSESGQPARLSSDQWSILKNSAHLRFAHLRDEYEAEILEVNDAVVSSQIASLELTYEARIDRYEQIKLKVFDRRIVRMKESQIEHAYQELDSRRAELEEKRNVTIVGTLEIAGLLNLVPTDELLETGFNGTGIGDVDDFRVYDTREVADSPDLIDNNMGTLADGGDPASANLESPHPVEEDPADGITPADIAIAYAKAQNLSVIDRRESGGALWIVDDSKSATRLQSLGFSFAKTGGRATGRRPAWYLDQIGQNSQRTRLSGLLRRFRNNETDS